MNDFNLNLPKTNFPMKGNLSQSEPKILLSWKKNKLYYLIRRKKKEKKTFVLHDGPPYANGEIHLGHALNKILKDIIIKSKNLSGFNALYTPGWDCHGLPIEQKVENITGKNKITDKEFRIRCRKYAQTQIEIQKNAFIRLGVLADWDNYYTTMDFKTESNILRTFYKILGKGYIYQNIKPVHWCFQCSSSLADSEVEYQNKYSTAIDVLFNAVDSNYIYSKLNLHKINSPISIVIWTTTPWTIPFNRAILIHPSWKYCLIQYKNHVLIIAKYLLKNFIERVGILKYKILGNIIGSKLKGLNFHHPFLNFCIPIVTGKNVNINLGTGAIHIAPGHGLDDYNVALKYNLEITNLVDEYGYFFSNLHVLLNKKHIFKIDNTIIEILKNKKTFLFQQKFLHSYPYCWRHKVPVIFRSTPQWFISIEKNNLRKKVLNKIKKVNWIPDWTQENISSLLLKRPDWCISRQRVWGVPIALFIHKKTGKIHPNMFNFTNIISQEIENYGIQAWWDLKIEDFIKEESKDYKKVFDTLDVWFDSGSTCFSILNTNSEYKKLNIDMYLEGTDQHRGWFMSSLILSIILKDSAPYKTVLTHGFTIDNTGKKMSKSISNIIKPEKIINRLGSDVLRIWVASSNYKKEISISDEVFKRSSDIYRRIRNTARFLLSNIYDFKYEDHKINSNKMVFLDQWAVHKTKIVQNKIINAYNTYDFHEVIKEIMNFCSIDMSSFYLDIIKDRLYTTKKNSKERRSCQTTIWYILESLVRWISPIISFTADEIWKYLPKKNRSKYVFLEEWFTDLFNLNEKSYINENFWNYIFKIRNEVNIVLENARIEKKINNSLEASIILYVDNFLLKKLKIIENELQFVFLTSKVDITDYQYADSQSYQSTVFKGLKILLKKAIGKKCPRCWNYNTILKYVNIYQKRICQRCILNTIGKGEERHFV